MKICVGTKNAAKLAAVSEIILEYPHLAHAEVVGIDVDSGVSAQPKSLDETIQGATNRARAAFNGCNFSIGLESGLMSVGAAKSGYMDVCVCVIFDGTQIHLGLSSAWEFPDKRITALMIDEGLDMSEAINKMGLTTNAAIGSSEGAIGIVTKGRLDRKAYTKEALRTALIHVDI